MKKHEKIDLQHLKSENSDEKSENQSDDENDQHENHIPKINRILNEDVDYSAIHINIAFTNYPVVREVAQKLKWKILEEKNERNWDICWTDHSIEPKTFIRMHFHQTINYIPGVAVIARKNLLGANLNIMKKHFQHEYNFHPSTWMLPEEYPELRKYLQTKKRKREIFIVKPEADCQGRGIYLAHKIEDIQIGKHCVIQKYLSNPYLIDNLKFDLRVYVLIGSISPLKIYFYNEGLARFATQDYEEPHQQNFKDNYLHLTNYAINKLNPKFKAACQITSDGQNTKFKRSMSSVIKLLKQKGGDTEQLMRKIKDISIKTIITAYEQVRHNYIHSQPEEYHNHMLFHILGLDILIDENLNPFLLEVNHTPSFATETLLDKKIKSNLIKDTLVLMNIDLQIKKELYEKAKNYQVNRIENGKRQTYHHQIRKKQIEKNEIFRQLYQKDALGGYQKIYPSKNQLDNQKYQKLIQGSKEFIYTFLNENLNQQKQIKFPKSFDSKIVFKQEKVQKMQKTTYYSKQIKRKLPSVERTTQTNFGHLSEVTRKKKINLQKMKSLYNPEIEVSHVYEIPKQRKQSVGTHDISSKSNTLNTNPSKEGIYLKPKVYDVSALSIEPQLMSTRRKKDVKLLFSSNKF